MPQCHYPGKKAKDHALRAEAEHRASQADERKARAVKLHLAGEPHHVIMARLNITRECLAKWLRAAGLAGRSAKAAGDDALGGGVPVNARYAARLGFD